MNLELAKRVLTHIKANPENFDMREGMKIKPTGHEIANFPCGTVACIAGWTVLLHNFDKAIKPEVAIFICSQDWSQIMDRAQKLLEIDDETVERLFYTHTNNPHSSPPENDEAAIARLENLIDEFSRQENTSQIIEYVTP